MSEFEQRKFRRGENAVKPWGGNISPEEPFPQALYNLASSRGFESQLALSKALGKKYSTSVHYWYTGKSVPNPDEFSSLLILFKPNDEELNSIVEPYGQLLSEGKGQAGGSTDTERSIKTGLKQIKKRLTPFDAWMEEFCTRKTVSLKLLANRLGFISSQSVRYGSERYLSLQRYSEILQMGSAKLNLSEEETAFFAESIAQTIEQAIEGGHRFLDGITGLAIRKQQEQIVYRTYNGAQAGKELGVTRERVRQLRDKLGLPALLTEEHLLMLKQRREAYQNRKNSH